MGNPAVVADVVGAYLALVDDAAPGLVEGLYLEGSVALRDFRPDTSDIDYVAVTARRPDALALAALQRVHGQLRAQWRRPCFDGIYLTWDDLASPPSGDHPGSHDGRFQTGGAWLTPVTWHTLARHGLACRGPAPAGVDIWTDPGALTAWVDRNLDEYWARLLSRYSRPSHPAALTDYATMWTVTGVSRLHYTLATGEITSKTGAGHYARQAFPARWHRIIDEALRIRERRPRRPYYRSPLARRHDLLAFAEMVIADAHSRTSDVSGAT